MKKRCPIARPLWAIPKQKLKKKGSLREHPPINAHPCSPHTYTRIPDTHTHSFREGRCPFVPSAKKFSPPLPRVQIHSRTNTAALRSTSTRDISGAPANRFSLADATSQPSVSFAAKAVEQTPRRFRDGIPTARLWLEIGGLDYMSCA